MKDSRLEITLSDKLKQQFKAVCDESEISMANKMREMIAELVKNHRRKNNRDGKVSDN